MSGTQGKQILQRASDIPTPASGEMPTAARAKTEAMTENRQRLFWQEALESNSILLWIVTNIRDTGHCVM